MLIRKSVRNFSASTRETGESLTPSLIETI
jgi:hypothetical protein